MTALDPRWAEVRGFSGPNPTWPGDRVTVEVRSAGNTFGATVDLTPGHTPTDYARALEKIVRSLDEMIHA